MFAAHHQRLTVAVSGFSGAAGALCYFFFERVLAFLIENGARTHTQAGVAGPAAALLEFTLSMLPRKTAVGDFLASTRLSLADVAAHLPLVQHVLDENSLIGRLALAKLILVARDVIRETDAFYGELADLELQLRAAPPANLYTRLGEWLLERSQAHPDTLLPPPPRRTQNRFCIESRLWPNLPVAKRLGWRRRIARCARPSTPSLAGSTRSHSTPGPSA